MASRGQVPDRRLRLAELLATVSLVTDHAHNVAAESGLRDAILSVQLGRLAGLSERDLSHTYYLALLYHVGCTGAAAIQSRFGAGDDTAVRRWLTEADFASRPQLMRTSVAKLARHWGPADWLRGMAAFMTLGESVPEAFANIADAAVRLSERLGTAPEVSQALRYAYARWDGKVFPGVPSGPEQSVMARLVHLVHVAQRYHQMGGPESAGDVVRSRRATEFDPHLADLWLANSHDLLRPLVGESVWDAALEAEPRPWLTVAVSHLDEVGRALADFVDIKSPYTLGHSARLSRLMEAAGAEAGLDGGEIATLRRAAQIHDIGNVALPDSVWTKAGPLNPAERERVRLHPYHSQRIISVCEPLRAAGELAGLHHERLDGSGYYRGLSAAALPVAARLLIAGEIYQSMLEERSWRPALTPAQAAAELRREQSAGRLDRGGVDAVLAAAGHAPPSGRAARSWPAGLTDREVDVLRLLARGRSNREIALALHISDATVHTHVINVYGKIGVNTRAGGTLFALEHDLIQVSPG